MLEDDPRGVRRVDRGEDAQAPLAVRALEHVEREYAAHQFRPSIPPAVQNVAVPLAFGWGGAGTVSHVVLAVAIAVLGCALVTLLGAWTLALRDVD